MKSNLTRVGGFLATAVILIGIAASSANADPGGVPGEIATLQAQVATLQSQVTALQNSDATLMSEVSALQGGNASLISEIAALQSSNASLASQIAALQSTDTTFASEIAALQSSNTTLASEISALQTALTAAGSKNLPGQVLWTYYETTEPFTACNNSTTDPAGCNNGGNGDNIVRLVNPNGAANPNFGSGSQTVCAMIYVFDDDEQLGECCGCPVSSAQLATFSVEQNLTADWGLPAGPEGGEHGNGGIAIVAASPNPAGCVFNAGIGPCNGGCDPTNRPGYSVTTANNLLGSITHNQTVQSNSSSAPLQTGLTEVGLSDDGGGNPINLVYLQAQCGDLVGNGTGGGICNCPVE